MKLLLNESKKDYIVEATNLPADLMKAYKSGNLAKHGDRTLDDKEATTIKGFGNVKDKRYGNQAQYAFDKASAEEISKEDAKAIFADKKNPDRANVHMLSGSGELITYDENGKPVNIVRKPERAWVKGDYTFKDKKGNDKPSTAYMDVNDVIDQSSKLYKVNLPKNDPEVLNARKLNPESRNYDASAAGDNHSSRADGHAWSGGLHGDRYTDDIATYVAAERRLKNATDYNTAIGRETEFSAAERLTNKNNGRVGVGNWDRNKTVGDFNRDIERWNIELDRFKANKAAAEKELEVNNARAELERKYGDTAAADKYLKNADYNAHESNYYDNRIKDAAAEITSAENGKAALNNTIKDYRASLRNRNAELPYQRKENEFAQIRGARAYANNTLDNAQSVINDGSYELQRARSHEANAKAALDRAQAEYDRLVKSREEVEVGEPERLSKEFERRDKAQADINAANDKLNTLLKRKKNESYLREAPVTTEYNVVDFEPWGQAAREHWAVLEDSDNLDAFQIMIDDLYPEGITETQLNDIVAYDFDWVADSLGIDMGDE